MEMFVRRGILCSGRNSRGSGFVETRNRKLWDSTATVEEESAGVNAVEGSVKRCSFRHYIAKDSSASMRMQSSLAHFVMRATFLVESSCGAQKLKSNASGMLKRMAYKNDTPTKSLMMARFPGTIDMLT